MSRNGETVSAFERELASYCGAKYAIAAGNGTVTLQAALIALGVKPGDRVATTPLTMAATTIAILNVGAVPVYCDVDPETWLMVPNRGGRIPALTVSLYGLHSSDPDGAWIDDAAQTLRPYHSGAHFVSLSFQASKHLALGEGGALLTDHEDVAARARSYLSLGYQMAPTQARIDSAALKSPTFDRHHTWPAINGRMNDITAAAGLKFFQVSSAHSPWAPIDSLLSLRSFAARYYRNAIDGCDWLTPQRVPDGWRHDYWCWPVACVTAKRALALSDAIVKHGGERPYPCWQLSYQEPAFRHLPTTGHSVIGSFAKVGVCPVAEDLQPRILQLQTNNVASAYRNAGALRKAIEELS